MEPNRKELPLVSVIVPAYNHEKLIRHSLRSIREQDYRPMEVLVCDDDSSDNTRGVVESLGYDFVRYIHVPHTGAPAATMNAGLRQAKGEIIMFLDGDDQWLPGKVKKQVDYFLSHPECDFLFSDAYYHICTNDDFMIPDADTDATNFTWHPPPFALTAKSMIPTPYIPPLTIGFRKAVLDRAGYLDEELRYTWDVEFCVRVADKGFRLHHIKDKLAVYRRHQDNLTTNYMAINRSAEEYIKILERFRHHFSEAERTTIEERWKYDWIKQSVKFEDIKTLRGVVGAPYFPKTAYYRAKCFFYFVLEKCRRKSTAKQP